MEAFELAAAIGREISMIAASSVDPEIIIRVHRFEDLAEDQASFVDLNSLPLEASLKQGPSPEVISMVIATIRDINSFAEEQAERRGLGAA